ncbi:Conserved_hypothetical protein [Hexamita inflata]|uniref:Uncharacterized protein n=1 Tax=Hexamita inflata TaxID=28002 RepID=A0AA86QUA3_9EUKA|nr:Conserved hypothetical protein [Hexamita inflata]
MSQDSDTDKIVAGKYYFRTAKQFSDLSTNYSSLCIGVNKETCTVYYTPFNANFTADVFVFHSKSIVSGYNNSYSNIQFNLDQIANPNVENSFINTCIQFTSKQNRTLIFKTVANKQFSSIFISMSSEIIVDGTELYETGFICSESITFVPITLLNEGDKHIKQLCSDWSKTADNQYIYDQIAETCENVIFVGSYVKYLVILTLAYVMIYQVAWVVMEKLYYFPKKMIVKGVILLLGLILTIILVCVDNSVLYVLSIFVFLFWLVYQIVQLLVNYEFAKDEHGRNIYQFLFTFKKNERSPTTVFEVFIMWVLTCFMQVAHAILLVTDIVQLLQFMKIDITDIKFSFVISPAIALCNSANIILAYFPYGNITVPIVMFIISSVTQTFTKSAYLYNLLEKWFDEREEFNKLSEHLPLELRPKVKVNWKNFLVKILLNAFSFYQNYTQMLIGNAIFNLFYTVSAGGLRSSITAESVFIMFVVSSYLYGICKYEMFIQFISGFYVLVYQTGINLCIIFIRFSQFVASCVMFIVTFPFFVLLDKTGGSYTQMGRFTFYTIFLIISQVFFTVLEIANYVLYPLLLNFSDFLPPCDFLMFTLGIIKQQKFIKKDLRKIFNESTIDSILRSLVCIVSFLLLALFSIMQQDMTVFAHCCIYSLVFFLIPLLKYQYQWQENLQFYFNYRNGTPSKTATIYSEATQAFNFLAEKLLTHKLTHNGNVYLEKINANYEHKEEHFENYLVNQMNNCFGYVPIIGPVMGIVSSFLNEPSVTRSGCIELQLAYFLNWIHFLAVVIAVFIEIYVPGPYYLICISVYFILTAVDAFDAASELIPGLSRVNLMQIFPKLKKWVDEQHLRALLESEKVSTISKSHSSRDKMKISSLRSENFIKEHDNK